MMNSLRGLVEMASVGLVLALDKLGRLALNSGLSQPDELVAAACCSSAWYELLTRGPDAT